MSEFTAREASEADAQTIAQLLHAAFDEYRAVLIPPSGVHKEDAASVRAKMETGHWVIAEAAGQPVGCVYYELRKEHVYLGRLAVLPAFRRRGIGAALIAYVETQTLDAGATRVRLGVRIALPALRSAYERRGYVAVEYRAHAGFAEPTYVLLEKTLDSA